MMDQDLGEDHCEALRTLLGEVSEIRFPKIDGCVGALPGTDIALRVGGVGSVGTRCFIFCCKTAMRTKG